MIPVRCEALGARAAPPAAPPGVPPAAAACHGWASPVPRRRCAAPTAAGPGITTGGDCWIFMEIPWKSHGNTIEIIRNPWGEPKKQWTSRNHWSVMKQVSIVRDASNRFGDGLIYWHQETCFLKMATWINPINPINPRNGKNRGGV